MQLTFKKQGNTLIVSLRGELDHHNAAKIREELDRRFNSSGAVNLILNFQDLKFMDSSGLGIIIGRYKIVSALGGKTLIAAPGDQTKRIMALAGIGKIISVTGSVEEAVGQI